MYNNILVKRVERHFVTGMAEKGWFQICLDMENLDPNNRYDFKPSYDSQLIGSPPNEGDYINCDIETKDRPGKSPIFNIIEWTPSTERSSGAAQQVGDVVQQHVNTVNIKEAYKDKPVSVNDKEVSMFVMGVIGRFLSGQKDFPVPEELRGMVVNARQAYQRGMIRDD